MTTVHFHAAGYLFLRNFRESRCNSHFLWLSALGQSGSRTALRTYIAGRGNHRHNEQNFKLSLPFKAWTKRLPQGSVRFLSQELTSEHSLKTISEGGKPTKHPDANDAACLPLNTQQEWEDVPKGLEALAEGPDLELEVASSYREEKHLQREQFFKLLQRCSSPTDVLDLLDSYKLSLSLVSSCLTCMWQTTKKMSEDQRRYEKKLMLEHPRFEQLCSRVMQEVRQMRPGDLVYSLLAVVKLGVSPRTRLVQTLLRASQERLNTFDEKSLAVLISSLEEMESCKNVDALKAGLRLLVELRMPQIKSVAALQTMMRCIGRDAPLSLKKKMEGKALSLLDQFTLPNSQYMFSTLAAMNFRSAPLLDACSNKIIENIHGIPFWRLVFVLRSCRDLPYRNHLLFHAVGDYVTSMIDVWQNKQIVLFLILFKDLGFLHAGLMDAFSEKVIGDPQSLILKDVQAVLRVYSHLNYLPGQRSQQFLEAVRSVFESYLSKILPVDLLQATYFFCLLDYFPQDSLDRLLQEHTLNELLTTASQYQEWNAEMLHYVSLCLELDNPLPDRPRSLVLGRPPLPSLRINPMIQRALQAILGDGPFREGVQLQNGYHIDFEIVLDKERRNIISESQGEDPTDNTLFQRVAVLSAPAAAFCFATTHPKGKLAMKRRHLSALGYHTILVPEQEFENLSEEQRIEFLTTNIFVTHDAMEASPPL
ncbi:FAST kinase domain-containing protein 2, mitochondrial [Latimeria chalumnae]|uniref:FAST kinase domain-containing protein 2, mitochondrial n=1 Tax=Latimeria chalumnae TaxID=7897 RepID=UPI0003C149A9|nr:PREDICTED: FAST kinase domain-containing protein 2 isoform X2 [Latimeria chalumnae]|eukprot:XP_006008221.1 PREDICTED: FAST kinase domain-containing protein 2 isoform X2 [Latimeria chalumnae]